MKLVAALALVLPFAAAAQYDPAAAPPASSEAPAAAVAPAQETAVAPAVAPQQGAAPGLAPAVAPQQAAPPAPIPSAWPSPAYAPPAYPPPHAPGQPPYARPNQRGAWYIGFGLGSGDASVTASGETHSFASYVYPDERGAVSVQFEVGATLSPRLLFGLELGAFSVQGHTVEPVSGRKYDSNLQASNIDAVFTFFPEERGLFLRGGAGVTTLSYELQPFATEHYRGLNLVGGVGYAFWLGRSFNLTLNVEGSRQWYSETGAPDSTQFWTAFVGCSWY